MIKNILIIGISCILFSCSKSEFNQEAPAEKVNDDVSQLNYKTLNVNGNVKSITCVNYKQFIPDSLLGAMVTKEDFVFDKKGNVVEEITYYGVEGVDHRNIYEYDKMNNFTRMDSYEKDGKKRYTILNSYNKQGKLLMHTEEENNIIREESHTFEELTDNHEKYRLKDGKYVIKEYSEGRIKSITKYTRANQVEYQSVYKYNASGKTIEAGSYQDNDTTKFVPNTLYTYDESGRLIQRQGYSSEVYDLYGNIISQVYENPLGTYTSKYIYDKKNNWIERITYLPNGKLRSILERKIEYFD